MNILDASVFLAYIRKEKGGEKLKSLSNQCKKNSESLFVHQVNFMEVVYKIKMKLPGYDINALLAEYASPWWGKINYMDTDLMLLASELKAKYQNASLADCIGLAYTKIFQGTFWTADKLLATIGEKETIAVKLVR